MDGDFDVPPSFDRVVLFFPLSDFNSISLDLWFSFKKNGFNYSVFFVVDFVDLWSSWFDLVAAVVIFPACISFWRRNYVSPRNLLELDYLAEWCYFCWFGLELPFFCFVILYNEDCFGKFRLMIVCFCMQFQSELRC